jgi:hypothetical protein
MLRIAILLAMISTLLSTATTASAAGEIFPVRLRGWEHCVGGDSTRLTSTTAIPLWLRMNENAHSWDLSSSPDFPDDPTQTFPLVVDATLPFRANRLVFWARRISINQNGGPNAYLTINGYLYVDSRRNEIKRLRGIFIEAGTFDLACGSSGKISTGRRLD